MTRHPTDWLAQPSTETGISFFDGAGWNRITYAEFGEQVLGAAEQLRRYGVRRGDRVALLLPSGPVFARYFFGTLALGATVAPIAPPGHHGHGDFATYASRLLAALEPACVVGEGRTLAMLTAGTVPRRLDVAEPLPSGGSELWRPASPDDLALIQFTSGSSGTPRGVRLSAAALVAQAGIIDELYGGLNAGDRVSSWLPLHHDMGLIGLFFTPVLHGCELLIMRPEDFVRRPVEWLATFGRRGVCASAAPNFALAQVVRRVTADHLQGMDFSAWHTLFVGADRINFALLREFYRMLAPYGLSRSTITPSYGLAEATLAVVGTPRGAEPSAVALERAEFSSGSAVRITAEPRLTDPDGEDDGHLVVSCGREPRGVHVTVIDENGIPLPDGHVGELRIRTPSLATGYLAGSADNERFTPSGYHTGDLGFRWREEIYVLGRVGDSVKVNGRFVTAEDLELAFAGALGVGPDRVTVVIGDGAAGVVTLVLVQQSLDAVDDAALDGVASAFGLDPAGLTLARIARAAVPRTTSGKPRRRKMWRDMQSGLLRADPVRHGRGFRGAAVTADAGAEHQAR